MADVHEPEIRSYNMSRIRSKNTKGEIVVRSFLHQLGFRFRIHSKKLPGKPDIVLSKYQTVVQVHGCFGMLMTDVGFSNILPATKNIGNPNLSEILKKMLRISVN